MFNLHGTSVAQRAEMPKMITRRVQSVYVREERARAAVGITTFLSFYFFYS